MAPLPATAHPSPAPLRHARLAILVVDLVGSTRLMQQHEEPTVRRWLAFMAELRHGVLPAANGRLVKSLGDGALVAFADPGDAARAALAVQRCIARQPAIALLPSPSHPTLRLMVRVGLHVGAVYEDAHDIYGDAVNVAVRIGALARPGEVLASAGFCAQLGDDASLRLEDLGECFVKHREQPLRVWRLGSAGVLPPPQVPAVGPAAQVVDLALTRPASALDSDTLSRAATALLDGARPDMLGRARELLDELVCRQGRDPGVQAALARWHRLSTAAGTAGGAERHAQDTIARLRQAWHGDASSPAAPAA